MTERAATMHFTIRGMTCAEEVDVLRREIGPIAGGEERLSFDILNALSRFWRRDAVAVPKRRSALACSGWLS